MFRRPHENVATVLVNPHVLGELELTLAGHDAWVWPIATAPIVIDGRRRASQLRRRMIEAQQGRWDLAKRWVPVWISFGSSWRQDGEPLPWAAHKMLWDVLESHAEHVRYRRRLGGVPPLTASTPR